MRKEIKVKQRDITDCGAACLASVAAHYKSEIPVSRIRQYAGTDKRGTNVLGLIEAAEKLGFQAKGAKGAFESLSKIPLPAIAHIIVKNVLHHYVVIYKVTKKHVVIMDPGDGRIHKKLHKTGIYGLYIGNTSEFFTRLFTIILLWAGSYFVINRELSPGELLSFYALIGYFTGPAASLIGANRNMQDAVIAADRLFEIIDLETESSNENKVELTPGLVGDIHFNNVTFRYGTRTLVFDGLNLTIKKEAVRLLSEKAAIYIR